ncbi:lactate utilization protein, partial [Ectothiorhodospiraceae bacterium WFHF3C12]|nr:lactate utilization protein [Ectothiorhodospiraceae bacterium WFHF3C12]
MPPTQAQPINFRANARRALADRDLQSALKQAESGFVDKRAKAITDLPDFEALRVHGESVKNHTLEFLDTYLEQFERNFTASGGQVHWAGSAEQACEAVLEICRSQGAERVIKAKTMAGEEVGINDAMESAGLTVTESDLGEYIIQIAGEPPSHIIAPAVHKTRDQVTALFERHHGKPEGTSGQRAIGDLVDEARQRLRARFLEADVGISGANFLVAETGTAVLVTNEGNADLSTTLPRVHIILAGIEKLVPHLDDATAMLRLLGRSATGQAMTAYTTFITGARRPDDVDGPEAVHIILIDNGRADMLGGPYQPMLRCIRCGACLNHCPVYASVGGHAYGWVYQGPMGSVLTPLFTGLDHASALPDACTLNGRCRTVCPVRIPLPDMLRNLRADAYQAGIGARTTRWALRLWSLAARRPRLYHWGAAAVIGLMSRLGRRRGRWHRL